MIVSERWARVYAIFLVLLILIPVSIQPTTIPATSPSVQFSFNGAPGLSPEYSAAPDDVVGAPSPWRPAPIFGQLNVLVIPVDFQDRNGTVTLDAIRTLVFGDMDSFVRENSLGAAYVVGDVLNWTRLPRGMDYYGSDTNLIDDRDFDGVPDSWKMLEDAAEILDPTVNFGSYDYFMVLHAGHGQESSRDPGDIWSVAYLGGLYIKTSTKGINRFTVVPETEARGAVPFGVYAHEFHHLLGLPDLYDPLTRFNYLGFWSLMDRGTWNGDPPGSSPSHSEGWSKQKLGWVPRSRIAYVNVSMAMNITLDPLEAPSAGIQLIRIPMKEGTNPEYYLVEVRAQIGFDSAQAQTGVLITYVKEGESRGKVRLQDAVPSTDTYTDGAWQVGQTYVDPKNGLSITVTAQVGNSFTVFVNRLGPAAELSAESFLPQSNEVRPGDTVQITLTVRNQGTKDASRFKVNVYINGTLLSTTTLTLAAGKSTQYVITWIATNGVYEFLAIVDPENAIAEATKSNNQLSLTLTVGFIISIELPLPTSVLGSDVGWWIRINGVTYNFAGPGNFTLSVTNGTQVVEVQSVIETALGSRLVFTAWADGDASNPRILAVTSDTSLTPTYKSQHLVTVNPNGGQATGGGWYDSGSQAVISAVSPSAVVERQSQLVFSVWSGDVASTDPQLAVPVDSPLTIVANWKLQYYVTITSTFGEVPGSGWYDAGSQVQLSVPSTMDEGTGVRRVFVGWGGDITGTELAITVQVDGPKTIASNWKTQYQLLLNTQYGNSTGSGWYDAGAQAAFSIANMVQPDGGTRYVFVRWTGDISTDSPSGTVTIDLPMQATAEWKVQYHVTFGARGLENQTALTLLVNDRTYSIESPGSASDWFDAGSELSPNTNTTFKARLVQYSFLRWENGVGETVTPPFIISGPETYYAVYAGSLNPPGCFIATATYGSEVAGEVQLLRNFRDLTVLKTSAGSAFMEAFNAWYYSFSPQVAVQVAGSENLRTTLRAALYPLIGTLLVSSRVYDVFALVPEVAIIASGFIAASLLGLVYLLPVVSIALWRVRRLRRLARSSLPLLGLMATVGLAALIAGELLTASALMMMGSALFVVGVLILTPMAISTVTIRRLKQ